MYKWGGGELFVDSTVIRNGIIIGTSIVTTILSASFPVATAVTGIIAILIPYLWPEAAGSPGTTQAQFTWDQWMKATEEMVDQKVDALIKDLAIESLKSLQSSVRDYQQAICNLKTDPTNAIYKEKVRTEFNDVDDKAKEVMIKLGNENNALPLLADYAQAANLHLLLLRDVVQYGVSWGFTPQQVHQHYSNTGAGNHGMIQLLATYTDHCVRWYDVALSNIKASRLWNDNKWKEFNAFRRNMTIMVLDIVSVWPTYDPILYKVPTRFQLTRTVYTDPIGVGSSSGIPFGLVEFEQVESSIVAPPYPIAGYKMTFQHTMNPSQWEIFLGIRDFSNVVYKQTLTIPDPQLNDDIWQISTNGWNVQGWNFLFTQSPDQYIGNPIEFDRILSGLPCKGNNPSICDPCQSENSCNSGPLNTTDPCNDKQLYSHRFSYMGAGARELDAPYNALTFFGYGWTHVSADATNTIDTEKITQIPAVKGRKLEGDVIKGPGSTGRPLKKW